MADRDVAKALSATRITTTSTSFQDGLTITWTPATGSKDYWLLGSAILDSSSTSIDWKHRLFDSTASVDYCVHNVELKDTTDLTSAFVLAKWTSPSSPVSQTFKLQFCTEAAATVGIDEMCLVAIESDSKDQYIETDAETTTTSATFQDAQTLTFTPATQGDYLIIAYCETLSDSNSASVVQLDVDGTASHLCDAADQNDITNYQPWTAIKKVNLTAASHTIKLQFKANAGIVARVRRRRILAIRLDTLRANSSDYTATRGTTSAVAAAPTDAASNTFTAAGSVDYFVLSNVMLDCNSTTVSTNARLSMDGSNVALHTREQNSTNNERPYAAINYKAFTAGSRTVKTQVYAEANTIVVGYSYQGVYVLDLRSVPATYIVTADPGSYSQTGTSTAFKAARTIAASAGSYSYTGTNTALKTARKIVAGAGSYLQTGTDVDFLYTSRGDTYVMSASPGSYGLTGTDTPLTVSRHLVGSAGSYEVSGVNALLKAARKLVVDSGEYIYTGTDIFLRFGYTLRAESGSYVTTSGSTSFIRTYGIRAELGSYDLAGTDPAFRRGYTISVNPDSYTQTGTSVSFLYQPHFEVGIEGTSEVVIGDFTLKQGITCSMDSHSELIASLSKPLTYNTDQTKVVGKLNVRWRA